MDFQGQGKATTGETEALAIIDSFTKNIFVIALPTTKPTPSHLDEIFFRTSSTPTLHQNSSVILWLHSWTRLAPRTPRPAGTTPKIMEKLKVGGDFGTAL
jgi:hypothetical protein